jgi:hypothetical protein
MCNSCSTHGTGAKFIKMSRKKLQTIWGANNEIELLQAEILMSRLHWTLRILWRELTFCYIRFNMFLP